MTAGWVDSGYKSGFLAHAASCGMSFEVVAKPDGKKGFAPLPRRWAVERTIGWLMLHRRLARDYETLPERSVTMIHWAMNRQHEPAAHRRIHPNLARRPSANRRTITDLDQMPS